MHSCINLTKEFHAHFWIWFNQLQYLSYLFIFVNPHLAFNIYKYFTHFTFLSVCIETEPPGGMQQFREVNAGTSMKCVFCEIATRRLMTVCHDIMFTSCSTNSYIGHMSILRANQALISPISQQACCEWSTVTSVYAPTSQRTLQCCKKYTPSYDRASVMLCCITCFVLNRTHQDCMQRHKLRSLGPIYKAVQI